MSSECIICLDNLLPEQPTYTCTKCKVIVHKICKEEWYRSRRDTELSIYTCPHCKYRSIIPNSIFTEQNNEDIPHIPHIENTTRIPSRTYEELVQYRQITTISNYLKCCFLVTCVCASFSTIIIGVIFFSNQFLITHNYTINA